MKNLRKTQTLSLHCARCEAKHCARLSWQNCANGTRHLRADCSRCGQFIKYLPQDRATLMLAIYAPEYRGLDGPRNDGQGDLFAEVQ